MRAVDEIKGVRKLSTVVSTLPMTTEELLALPEDGIDRELIRGQLRE